MPATEGPLLDQGTISFTIESRILRELGERLVKQPEVAIVELVKNAYDADAGECTITYEPGRSITVKDTGLGMTLARLREGWMRIGTSSKEANPFSEKYSRLITGEKGIGRFAVRFLGRALHIETVARDPQRLCKTRLVANFDWPAFDRHEDLGKIQVPYQLHRVPDETPLGTALVITRIRAEAAQLDLKKVRTGSIGILTPLRSLFRQITNVDVVELDPDDVRTDPGFILNIQEGGEDEDVAAGILTAFALRAQVQLDGEKLDVRIFQRGSPTPYLHLVDTYPNQVEKLYADIRFFPRRAGAFARMPLDGRLAQTWIKDNSGIAVFDRNFRIQPYGTERDDWLQLARDAAQNLRDPRSSLAKKHFPMSPQVRAAPSENWMLRLPSSAQLVGLVQVEGQRTIESHAGDQEEGEPSEDLGLIASADREGFVENAAYAQLVDIIRSAVEALAYADRKISKEDEERRHERLIATARAETKSAIREVKANPNIAAPYKARIVAVLAQTQERADQQEESARNREQQLEVMSLLGVVAGFMTHEFGVAVQELESTHKERISERCRKLRQAH